MRTRRGFTLIELLVVIAIIGILATLVITQLAGAQVRARNSNAKSDVTQMGKAIETWKTNNGTENVTPGVAVTGTAAGTTLNGTTAAGGWAAGFGNVSTGYPVKIDKSPSTSYTYGYVTNGTNATLVAPTAANATASLYCVGTNVSTASGVTDTAFYVENGSSKNGAAATSSFGNGTCS